MAGSRVLTKSSRGVMAPMGSGHLEKSFFRAKSIGFWGR